MEQIEGLHTCKPSNAPQEGQTKNFVVTVETGTRTGNQWNKIRSLQNGGTPYTVIAVKRTDRPPDNYGNVSFNLVIEPAQHTEFTHPAVKEFTDSLRNAPQTSQEARHSVSNPSPPQYTGNLPQAPVQHYYPSAMSKDDYWTIKDQRDREREARFVAQQPRIERQHSQAMALQLAAIFPDLVCDGPASSGAIFNFGKLHSLITQFQRDIGYIPKGAEAK